jgi:glutamine cyclotransferase
MKSFRNLAIIFFIPFILFNCGAKKNDDVPAVDSLAINYTVLSILPHDPTAFTQGLVIHNSKILESTGQANSWIAEVNPGTGKQDIKITLDRQFFGEGITVLNNKIYQLTWKHKTGFIYEATTYKKIGEFTYATEGWGITTDKKNLIMSDGSERIYFLDTVSFKPVRTLTVMNGNIALKKINELEYFDGYLFANIWESGVIVKVDPANGKVVGKIDLTPIANEIRQLYPTADVLNGIAYDSKSKAILVTGKLWPKTYLIRLQ